MEDERFKIPIDENVKFSISDLNSIINILLGENGCLWDKKQTIKSLSKYLLEECYEVVDAISKSNTSDICEELGDCLFQIVFISRIAEDEGLFSLEDVVDGIARKMISRHTHIFGNDTLNSAEEVEAIWEKNKASEKKYGSVKDKLNNIPESMPALMRAEKVIAKVPNKAIPTDELINEAINTLEFIKKGKTTENEEIIGNLLLQIASISRSMQINAEFALTKAVKTYINKFENIEDQGI